jgi:hypothetical protein
MACPWGLTSWTYISVALTPVSGNSVPKQRW